MAVRTVGAKVVLDGEKEYKQAIQELSTGNRTLATEMKKLQAEFKGNTDSVEYLTKAGQQLEQMLQMQHEKVQKLKEIVQESANSYGEADKRTQEYIQQLNKAETAEIELTRSIKENAEALKVAESGLSAYKDAISEIDDNTKVLDSELEKLQAQYKNSTDSQEYLTKSVELLSEKLGEQQNKVQLLKEEVQKAEEVYGKNSKEVKDLTVKLNQAETAEINLQHAIEENNEALENQGEKLVGLGDTVDQLADKFGIKIPDGAKQALNGMQGFSAGTAAAMATAAAAIVAVVETVKKLGDLTIEVAAKVDEYITESAITNVPIEILQAWDYAAPLIDVDAETIKGAMTKITQAMGDAKDGTGAAAEAFEMLGVSVTDAVTGELRSSEEVFYDVIDALGGIENQTERSAVAMDLLGKSAQELNPLINAGSEALKDYAKEAKDVGYILDEYQVRRLGEVDDAYQKLQLTIEASKKQLAADFAPAAKEAMELFSDVVQKAGQVLERSGIVEYLASSITSVISIGRAVGELITSLPGFDQAIAAVNITLKALAYTLATIADSINVVVGLLPSNWGSGKLLTALGANAKYGQYSNLQKLNGTADYWDAVLSGYSGNGGQDMSGYGYDSATGRYYDKETGNYIYPGFNAGGTNSWRGGLTLVGEAGPELVSLPRGSQIYNASESQSLAGDIINMSFNINVDDLQDLQKLISWGKTAKITYRMGAHNAYDYLPDLS